MADTTASVAAGESDIECSQEVVLGESGTPRWIVVFGFFRRFMEHSGEFLKLLVSEVGRTTGARFVVERGV
ncbi:hypothetical protein [Halococcus salifodinae]|uniref:hypothetical protein n=1 Tax=Halococcus salifodinae TaxID=36738 RepID=UPI001267A370